ncbi:hypothetical protein IKG38_03680 [Candidatus Saccharibacteria bacterium]|nr:hypothetical protein [Candidatus Saccharibacteria bacterium]
MKLRNKKTGHIIECSVICSDENLSPRLIESNEGIPITLAELNEEWEDYEEPKESEYYWYIGYKNDIRRTKYHHISDFADNQVTVTRKEIGNCFESLEEAEKAVEKLKAWKRLKDGGITFKNWTINQTGTIDCFATWGDNIPPSRKNPTLLEDLDLLFGGEE